MEVKNIQSGVGINILASDNYTAIPMKITGSAIAKAGSPITSEGAVGTAATAVGVLLYDVDPLVNPNAAVLVKAVINSTKAKAHSEIDLAGITAKVPGIVLRDNIGVNTTSD